MFCEKNLIYQYFPFRACSIVLWHPLVQKHWVCITLQLVEYECLYQKTQEQEDHQLLLPERLSTFFSSGCEGILLQLQLLELWNKSATQTLVIFGWAMILSSVSAHNILAMDYSIYQQQCMYMRVWRNIWYLSAEFNHLENFFYQ